MKFQILLILLIAFTFSACKTTQSTSPSISKDKYVPNKAKGTYFGMPMFEFTKKNIGKDLNVSGLVDFRTEISESFNSGDVKEITYYFNDDKKQSLYEYIVEYKDGINVSEIAEEKFGKPNSGKDWIFDSKKGYNIKIWLFQQKIVIAGALKGTAWDGTF